MSRSSPWTCRPTSELACAATGFVDADVDGAWLVLACTGVVDAAVAEACVARRVWCVRADDASKSSAWVPAVARVDDVVVSVTAGGDPRRAVALRDAIALAVDTGDLPLRRTGPATGSVALVGGGPGDPGLLTVRGRQLLAGADVVVRDRLAPAVGLPADVEVVDVGKMPGGPSYDQRAIEQLLVDRARAEGKRVVRLKGGDVHLFGRGMEEVAACVEAGVAVEVVPGVSQCLRGPGLGGDPRDRQGRDAVGVGRQRAPVPRGPGSTVDWDALARLGGTVILLMAVERLASCADALVAGGLAPTTPVAVIHEGTLPTQQVVVTTLYDAARRRGRRCFASGRRRRRGRVRTDDDGAARRRARLEGRRFAGGRARPAGHGGGPAARSAGRGGVRRQRVAVDHGRPCAGLVDEGEKDITVVPLLLGAASHSKTDVAASVQAGRFAHPGMMLRYGRPLGPHPVVVDVLARRLAEAGATEEPVVLVAGGSLDPDANAQVAATARLLWEGRAFPSVDIAFASTTGPTVPQALERLRAQGFSRVAIARYFLGPGYLPRLVETQAATVADLDVVISDPLGASDGLATLVLGRFDEARAGDIRMNCDACLYRVPYRGHESAVGLPHGCRHSAIRTTPDIPR